MDSLIFILQVSELRHRTVKQLAQGHTASKELNRRFNTGSLTAEFASLTILTTPIGNWEKNIEKSEVKLPTMWLILNLTLSYFLPFLNSLKLIGAVASFNHSNSAFNRNRTTQKG